MNEPHTHQHLKHWDRWDQLVGKNASSRDSLGWTPGSTTCIHCVFLDRLLNLFWLQLPYPSPTS